MNSEEAKRLDSVTHLLQKARVCATSMGIRQFAESIGLLPSRYAAIEHGREIPTEEERDAILKGYGIKL